MMKLKRTLVLSALLMFAAVFAALPLIAAEEPLDARFLKADTNKDGKLDKQEFEAFLVYLNTLKLAKPQKKVAPPTETEVRYEKPGSYLQSAMGYVPVKNASITETTESGKSGGCCGGKMKAAETESAEKKGGCCGGTKTTESTSKDTCH
jgi:hypothetical protein